MKLRKIKIGQTETENNVFMAPLAGYTNYPFRMLCAKYGAGLCFTEMVSAKGLKYGSETLRNCFTPRSGSIRARCSCSAANRR